MDKSSRQKYVDMAKDSRNNAEKMTSTGVSLSSILKEQDHIRRAEEEENRQIEMIVRDEACSMYTFQSWCAHYEIFVNFFYVFQIYKTKFFIRSAPIIIAVPMQANIQLAK